MVIEATYSLAVMFTEVLLACICSLWQRRKNAVKDWQANAVLKVLETKFCQLLQLNCTYSVQHIYVDASSGAPRAATAAAAAAGISA